MNQIREFLDYIFNGIKFWIIIQPWQAGIRVRNGKHVKKLTKGIYFRIPYFDSVYVQENRLRVVSMPVQTLTSSDFKTVTLSGAIGYIIEDIEVLYQTLYHPESTIANMAMSEVAEYIFTHKIEDIAPATIEAAVLKKLNADNYGLKFEFFKIMNFAVVRTFRFIQDQSWISEGLAMDEKA